MHIQIYYRVFLASVALLCALYMELHMHSTPSKNREEKYNPNPDKHPSLTPYKTRGLINKPKDTRVPSLENWGRYMYVYITCYDCAVLCHDVLCCAVLCCAMLCYVVLCHVSHDITCMHACREQRIR